MGALALTACLALAGSADVDISWDIPIGADKKDGGDFGMAGAIQAQLVF